jgi:hypothetical protein
LLRLRRCQVKSGSFDITPTAHPRTRGREALQATRQRGPARACGTKRRTGVVMDEHVPAEDFDDDVLAMRVVHAPTSSEYHPRQGPRRSGAQHASSHIGRSHAAKRVFYRVNDGAAALARVCTCTV